MRRQVGIAWLVSPRTGAEEALRSACYVLSRNGRYVIPIHGALEMRRNDLISDVGCLYAGAGRDG